LSWEQSAWIGWLEALHPDDREQAMHFWDEAMRSVQFKMEGRMSKAVSHGYRWFQTRSTPVRDDGGAIIEWLGISTDIHDLQNCRRRQQVLVAELQHRTRNLMGVIRSMVDWTL
jgi:PAS domain-containing protein